MILKKKIPKTKNKLVTTVTVLGKQLFSKLVNKEKNQAFILLFPYKLYHWITK